MAKQMKWDDANRWQNAKRSVAYDHRRSFDDFRAERWLAKHDPNYQGQAPTKPSEKPKGKYVR